MAGNSGFEFMFGFVREYLDGEMDRLGFDLDFDHYLIKHYPKMERKDEELADCFAFYLAEQGADKVFHLCDHEHKAHIQERWDEFTATMNDGLF